MNPMPTLALAALVAAGPVLAQVAGKDARREAVDTLARGEWWTKSFPEGDWRNLKVPRDQTVAFALYTVQDRVLKLTAQLYPLLPEETRTVPRSCASPVSSWRSHHSVSTRPCT